MRPSIKQHNIHKYMQKQQQQCTMKTDYVKTHTHSHIDAKQYRKETKLVHICINK